MKKVIQIQWTAAHLDEAREISQALVMKKWVACVSILPLVESWYIWEGEIEQSSEVKVLLKTLENNYSKIEKFIRQNHSYEVPEILVFEVVKGSTSYIEWIASMTK